MSTMAQAYRVQIDEQSEGYTRPHFRVIEGGHPSESVRRDHVHGNTAPATRAHANQAPASRARVTHMPAMRVRYAQAPAASAHVFSLRTRVRLVAMAVAVFVLLGAAWTLSDFTHAVACKNAFEQATYETITVHTGDSLWSIADAHPVAGRTTDEVVRHIRESNGLTSACIQPGMTLMVPQGA